MILRIPISLKTVPWMVVVLAPFYLLNSRLENPKDNSLGNLVTSNVSKDKNNLQNLQETQAYLNKSALPKDSCSKDIVFEDAAPLSKSWASLEDMEDKLERRRRHVEQVCEAEKLNKRSAGNQPNAWEFLINKKYELVWCSIYKAASSTWLFHFNTLAGYSNNFQQKTMKTPTALAREKYPRPTVEILEKAMKSPNSVSFMISRHPLERLVSAFRDKIESGAPYYRKLAKTIVQLYPALSPSEPTVCKILKSKLKSKYQRKTFYQHVLPSFPQFVQYILDSTSKGKKLDEHWVPMYKFCTPCLVNFSVFAKMETLEEDGNYIIYKSGIQDVIQPKIVNRSFKENTDTVAPKYLCQLSKKQMDGLINLYNIDFKLFDYTYDKYINCTRGN